MVCQNASISALFVGDFTEVVDELMGQRGSWITVETAGTASDGVNRLSETTVDCVVSSAALADQTGLDFLRTVRESHPDLPFILATTEESEAVASEAMAAGATGVIRLGGDSDDTDQLVQQIEIALERPPVIETEHRLQTIAEAAVDVLWMMTADWEELLFLNSAYEDIWGQSIEETRERPQSFLDGVHPDDRDAVREAMADLSSGEAVELECRVNPNEDFSRWVWVQGEPVIDSEGTVTAVVGFARDITHWKDRERELEQYETIIESVPEGVFVLDQDAVIRGGNETAAGLLGFDQSDLIGMPFEDLIDRGIVEEAIEERYTTALERLLSDDTEVQEERFEFTAVVDGDERILEARVALRPTDKAFRGTIGIVQDITERRKREAALEQLHASTQDLMAATTARDVASISAETATQILELPMNSIHFYDADADALVPVAWSDALETALGGPPPEIPADEGLASRVFETGESQVFPDVRETDNVLNRETPFRSELHIPLGDHGVLLVASTAPRDFDATDETLAHVLAANVEAALDRVAREQELKSQNERLDEFASIVSHDLRNPLNVAQGRLQLLGEQIESEHLDAIDQPLDRMEGLIADLQTLSRHGDAIDEFEAVDLAQLVEGCWQNVSTGSACLDIQTEATIEADTTRLKQLFENLFRNAVEHGGDDVTVSIGDLDDGDGFYVEDTGAGVPADVREELFDGGVSTKDAGSGLGLAIVNRIVEAHGWTIDLADSETVGARFEVRGVTIGR